MPVLIQKTLKNKNGIKTRIWLRYLFVLIPIGVATGFKIFLKIGDTGNKNRACSGGRAKNRINIFEFLFV